MRREAVDPCGSAASPASYRRHLRHGEATCPDCRRAHADAVNAYRMSYRQGVRRTRKRPAESCTARAVA